MPQKVTHTALLECNHGTTESQLAVTSQDFFFIEGKPVATENDKQSEVNIKPFGQCRLKPIPGGFLPCIPVPLSWKEVTAKDELNNMKILLETSICLCSTGGTISIKDKGHQEDHSAV